MEDGGQRVAQVEEIVHVIYLFHLLVEIHHQIDIALVREAVGEDGAEGEQPSHFMLLA